MSKQEKAKKPRKGILARYEKVGWRTDAIGVAEKVSPYTVEVTFTPEVYRFLELYAKHLGKSVPEMLEYEMKLQIYSILDNMGPFDWSKFFELNKDPVMWEIVKDHNPDEFKKREAEAE